MNRISVNIIYSIKYLIIFLEYIKDIKIIDHIDMNLKYITSTYRYSVYNKKTT